MGPRAGAILFLGFCHVLRLSGFVTRQHNENTTGYDARLKLKTDLLAKHHPDVMPPYTTPVIVGVGLTLHAISDLDARKQILTTDIWLKLEWLDSRLQWNSSEYNGIKAIEIPDHKVWQPDIEIYNRAKVSSIDPKGDVYVVVRSKGYVTWIAPGTVFTTCNVDLLNYPYDTHICELKLGSWTKDGFHIDLYVGNAEGVDVSNLLSGGEWELIETDSKKNSVYYPCCPEPYVDVTFSLTLQRRSPLFKVAILSPLIVAILLTLTSFWISPLAHERLTLNCLSSFILFFILLYFMVSLPQVGNRIPIVVSFCGSLLILSSVVIILSVIFMSLAKTLHHQHPPQWIKGLLQSRALMVLCISGNFEPRGDLEINESLTASENVEDQAIKTDHQHSWVQFFQIIDRIAFLLYLVIVISITVAFAT